MGTGFQHWQEALDLLGSQRWGIPILATPMPSSTDLPWLDGGAGVFSVPNLRQLLETLDTVWEVHGPTLSSGEGASTTVGSQVLHRSRAGPGAAGQLGPCCASLQQPSTSVGRHPPPTRPPRGHAGATGVPGGALAHGATACPPGAAAHGCGPAPAPKRPPH